MTAMAVTQDGMLLYQDVEYNAQRNAVFWETRPVLVLRRTAEIGEHPCVSALTGAPALLVLLCFCVPWLMWQLIGKLLSCSRGFCQMVSLDSPDQRYQY